MKKFRTRNRLVSIVLLIAMLSGMMLAFPLGASAATAEEHTSTGSSIRNDYLEATIESDGDYKLYTTGGDPNKTSDNNAKLLYDCTSHTVININGTTSKFASASSVKKTPEGDSLYAVATINGVKVEQFMSFVYNTYTSRYDTVEYKYVFTNTSASDKSAGTRIFFDTMLASNDSAPFIINGEQVTTARTYTGAAIPQNWQVLDSFTSPTTVAIGTFYNDISERPDKVQFLSYSNGSGTQWDCTANGGSIGDSAVNVYFNPVTLAPGESRTVKTCYGISDFIPNPPTPDEIKLTLGATKPNELLANADNTAYLGNPFTYTGYVTNSGNVTINNVTATVALDNGLSADRTTVSLGNVTPGQQISFAIAITAEHRTSAATLGYTVTLTADNLEEPVVGEYTVRVPALVHEHTFAETGRTPATCTEYGVVNYACSCGETKITYLPREPHRYVSEVTQPATCTTPGVMTHTCSGCGDSYLTYIYAEHSYSETEFVPATCTVDGHRRYDCANCDDFYVEVIPGSHDYVATVTRVATAEHDGEITYTCSICGHTYVETVPARASANILLVQDRLPWTENVNSLLLARLQINGYITGWDQTTTANFTSIDLSAYNVIFVANDQSTATYNQLARFNETITEFVRAGGVVVYGACDHGWAGGNISYALPGGVTKGNYYSYRNYIVDGSHNVVTGVLTDGKSLTDAILYSTYSSHTYFTNLPEDAVTVLADANGRPTLVEYPLGDGYVIASGLTWEYTYVRSFIEGTSFAKCVYDDLLVHAALMSDPCQHEYGEATVVPATCTEDGYTVRSCALCGAIKKEDFTDSLGHDFGDWVTVENATATETGLKVKYCSRCDETIEELIPVIDGPSIRVEAASDSVIFGQEMTFILVIEGLDPIKSMAVTPFFDTEIFDLVSITWLKDAFLQDIEDGSLRSVSAWETLTDVNCQVYAVTLRAKSMSFSTTVGCELLVQDGDGMRSEPVVGKTVSVIACPHESFSYVEMNGDFHAKVCDVCGYTEAERHVLAEGWESDGNDHWHVCVICGADVDAEDHVYDHACDADCNVCGYERDVPGHIYSDAYFSDYRNHWHECTVCGTPDEVLPHEYDGICYNTCNTCGYIRVGAEIIINIDTYENIKSGAISINFNSDIFEILEAEFMGDALVFDFELDTGRGVFAFGEPTTVGGSFIKLRVDAKDTEGWRLALAMLSATVKLEDADGVRTDVALTPENVASVKFLYTHDYSADWTVSDTEHWHVCVNCGSVNEESRAAHEFDSVCDADCNVCGAERIPPHAFEEVWSNDRENHWHECELCDAVSDYSEHEFGGDSTCDVCGYVRYLLGDVDNDNDIDPDDAIYLLYHISFFEDTGDYPVIQRCDFNGDLEVDSDDAIYLLYYIMFEDTGDYELHDMPIV